MQQNKFWDKDFLSTITKTKYLLSNLSVVVRTDQYKILTKNIKINSKMKVLDVGVASNEVFKDSNMFEKLYPWHDKLTLATIEDPKELVKLYPKSKVVKIQANKKLPFKNKEFDLVTAWATLEHVGNYKRQEIFINELNRVGKKVFLTTPYRGCVYEPHSGIFFIHWFPLKFFRRLMIIIKKDFWSHVNNLNPLYVKDIKKMKLINTPSVLVYNMLGIIPSHLLLIFK